ncbi:hypothetical protein LINGRAHAP2_LOCUS30160, partial [Linum grandiflorum]
LLTWILLPEIHLHYLNKKEITQIVSYVGKPILLMWPPRMESAASMLVLASSSISLSPCSTSSTWMLRF